MDRISEIVEDKRMVRVFLDSGEELRFCKALWHKAPLFQLNQEIDTEELKDWMLKQQYPYSLRYAIDLLSRRDYSSGEIAKKLRYRQDSEENIEMVLYKLQKERLLDDRRFAQQHATVCVRKQYGKARIRHSLREKEIPDDLIEEILEGLDKEEAQSELLKAASKMLARYANEEDPRKKKAKLLAALARRGYGYEESKQALETIMCENQV